MDSKFYPGDLMVIRRGFKGRWNHHRQLDGLSRNAHRDFTITQVFEPNAFLDGTNLHSQWLAYDDGNGAFGVANGKWFEHAHRQ